jgi:DNA modification methylase
MVPRLPANIIHAKDKLEAKKLVLTFSSNYGTISEESLSNYMIDSGIDVDFLDAEVVLPEVDMDYYSQEPESKEGLIDDDHVPEPLESKVKRGEVWALGEHRLMCGDSTKIEDVEKLMNGDKADMVFTDPPYGISYEQEHRTKAPKQTKTDVNNYFPVIAGDDTSIEVFTKHILDFFGSSKRIFIWGILNGKNLPDGGSYIVWDKKTEAQANCPFGDFDVCWSKNTGWKMIRSMWGGFHSKEKGEDRLHPTQKPIDLIEQFFSLWGKETKTVVDLFGGSGSTLIACEKTGRKCFMMELDEHYCGVIIARWEQFTGKQAVKVS